jgi:hypothetical protein
MAARNNLLLKIDCESEENSIARSVRLAFEVRFQGSVEASADIFRQGRGGAMTEDVNRLLGGVDDHAAIRALLEVSLKVGLE